MFHFHFKACGFKDGIILLIESADGIFRTGPIEVDSLNNEDLKVSVQGVGRNFVNILISSEKYCTYEGIQTYLLLASYDFIKKIQNGKQILDMINDAIVKAGAKIKRIDT